MFGTHGRTNKAESHKRYVSVQTTFDGDINRLCYMLLYSVVTGVLGADILPLGRERRCKHTCHQEQSHE